MVDLSRQTLNKVGHGSSGPKNPVPQKTDSALSQASGVFGKLLGIVGKFAAVVTLAVGAVLGFLALPTLMTQAVQPFVRQLNPGIVEHFNQVLDNLAATVGFGLEPVIAQAVATVRMLTAIVAPAVRELRPVMRDLSEAVGTLATGGVALAVAGFRALNEAVAPLMRHFLRGARVIGQVFDVMAVFVNTIREVVSEFAGFDLTDLEVLFKPFTDAIRLATLGLTYLFAAALKLTGSVETLAKFRAGIARRIEERRAPAGGFVAAPKDVSTGGAEDIARRISERAFAAQAGAVAAKSDTQLLEEILGAVTAVESMDIYKTVRNAVKDGVIDASDAVKNVTRRGAAETVRDVSAGPVGAAVPILGLLDLAARVF